MTTRERAIAHGIDPDDPKYLDDSPYNTAGVELCRWCVKHTVDQPRLLCDVQQADFALLEPATRQKCRRCKEPYTESRPICPACEQREAASRKDNERRERGRPGRRGSGSVYVDDGFGCVERASFAERLYYPEWFR